MQRCAEEMEQVTGASYIKAYALKLSSLNAQTTGITTTKRGDGTVCTRCNAIQQATKKLSMEAFYSQRS